ncbi:prepilin peptidase [Paenibacillus terrigena]|uniref:prepilin peptidase n=1 Tax=Paenibacillus terrigena TaxID=369333 RepID=UPI0028D779FA|nr:prepilin peptidase [Paenibacillus terrigena]
MGIEIWLRLIIGSSLVLCSIYDMKERIIPNVLVAVIAVAGLMNSMITSTTLDALIGALFPSALLLLVRMKFSGIGAGDIKLLSATGLWLGWLLNLYVFLFACIAVFGYILLRTYWLRHKIRAVPFAPFVTLGILSLYVIDIF